METTADPRRLGLLAEYDNPADLVRGAASMRERGYRRLDAFTPYEVPGLAETLGVARTRLPLVTLVAAAVGGTLAYLIQWWTNAVAYPIPVGGRPLHAAPAFVPITFETAILFAGVATFLGVLVLSRLTRLWAPIDEIDGFERASVDRYWLAVDRRDPSFDPERTARELEDTGPLRVVGPPSRPSLGIVRCLPPLILVMLPFLAGCDVAGPEPNFSLERMIHQPRYDAWEASAVFADGKAMRDPPAGSVHAGSVLGPPALVEGRTDGRWVEQVVPEVDAALLRRGRDRFEIYCAPCHGIDGEAATSVAQSMSLRTPPPLVDGDARTLPPGRVFHVATYGYGLMPAYGHQLSIGDRWAVAAWVEVLRLRFGVPLESLPPALYERARRELEARDEEEDRPALPEPAVGRQRQGLEREVER
ncbi:MAG TPA: quinol:electron acceptor oxidoreductase subunit ActD [Planctomycetota bacterium]|nr:quinol:electron acceptor oxidoreductase subunit ActD [Planctomycetota bacterium]